MKYVVLGYIGFDNFGDEAIAYVLSQKLKAQNSDDIVYISSNPIKTSKMYGVKSCGMLGFIPHVLKSDILISAGGSLLQDVTSLKSLLYYLFVIAFAKFCQKRVELLAQGIGPINSEIGRLFTRFILSKVDKITVRDVNSQKLLENWSINAELVKDSVFDIDVPKTEKTGRIGIQLRQFKGVNKEFLNRLSDYISENFNGRIIDVISLQDSMDFDICNTFANLLKNRGFEVNLKNGLNIQEAIKVISSLDSLIAMRYHANVIAIKAGVKTIAINYDPKVAALAEEYNLPIIEL